MGDKDIPAERALTRTPQPKDPAPQQGATHRQRSFAYVQESLDNMPQEQAEPDVPQEPMPLRTREPRMTFGPYRGQKVSEVPTEHLEWMETAFENGADPDVQAELRRRRAQ
jgi:hypothetical protein